MESKTVYNCLQCLGEFSTEQAIVYHIKSRHQVSEVKNDMFCVSTHEVISNIGLKGSSLGKPGDKQFGVKVGEIGNKDKPTSFFGDLMGSFDEPGKMKKLPLVHKAKSKDTQHPVKLTVDQAVVPNLPIGSKKREAFKAPIKQSRYTEKSSNTTNIEQATKSPPPSSCLTPSPEPVLTPPPVCSPVRKFQISPPRLKRRKTCEDPDCRPCSREEDCLVCSHCTNKSLK